MKKVFLTDGDNFHKSVYEKERFFNLTHMDVYLTKDGNGNDLNFRVCSKMYIEESDTMLIRLNKIED